MKTGVKFIKKNNLLIFLLLILAISFYNRISLINYGNPPQITINEEKRIVDTARDMIILKDINPHFFNYPSFIYYLIALLGFVINLTTTSDQHLLFIVSRFAVVCFSMMSIVIIYLIGKEILNKHAALFSVLFLSFSVLHLENSYFVNVDMPMVAWLLLSFLFAAKIFNGRTHLKNYLFAGFFIGLASSTKYNAIIGIIFLLAAHALSERYKENKVINKNLLIYSAALIVSFFLITPFSLFDYNSFIQSIRFESIHYKAGHLGAETNYISYLEYLKIIWNEYGIVPILFAALGSFVLWKDYRNRFLLLIAFPSVYFLFIGSYKVYFARNILITIPFLSLLIGFGFQSMIDITEKYFFERSKKMKLISFSLLLIMALFIPVKNVYSFMEKTNLIDTRIECKEWMENNLSPDSKILRESYTPELSNKFSKVTAIGLIGKFTESLKTYDYILISSANYERIMRDKSKKQLQTNYEKLFSDFKLLMQFTPDNIRTTGSTIKIFCNQ